jgi:hypothetical protein
MIMLASIAGIVPGHYEVLVWGSMGIVAVVLMGFGLLWFRRKYHPDSTSGETLGSSFSMQSVEGMRDRGLISEEEFRRLRAKSLGLDAPVTDNDNSALSSPNDVDDGATEEPQEVDPSNESQDHKESK